MSEKAEGNIYVGKKGRLSRKIEGGIYSGIPTKGQQIIDKANQILKEDPLRGVRYNKDDPDTKSGPVKIIVPGKK